MFGRQAKLPIDLNVEEEYDPATKLQVHLCSHDPPHEVADMNRKATEADVKKNIEAHKRSRKSAMMQSMGRVHASLSDLWFGKRVSDAKSDVVANWISSGRVRTRLFHPLERACTNYKN